MKLLGYFEWIDFHVLFMVVFLFICSASVVVFPLSVLAYSMVPQFMILTRAWDQRKMGHRVGLYILGNELLVIMAIFLNWLAYVFGFRGIIVMMG